MLFHKFNDKNISLGIVIFFIIKVVFTEMRERSEGRYFVQKMINIRHLMKTLTVYHVFIHIYKKTLNVQRH